MSQSVLKFVHCTLAYPTTTKFPLSPGRGGEEGDPQTDKKDRAKPKQPLLLLLLHHTTAYYVARAAYCLRGTTAISGLV